MRLRHLPSFDWKFLQIGILRAKDLGKNVPILQERRFTPAPWTLLVIRAVLLQSLYGVCNPVSHQLYFLWVSRGFNSPLKVSMNQWQKREFLKEGFLLRVRSPNRWKSKLSYRTKKFAVNVNVNLESQPPALAKLGRSMWQYYYVHVCRQDFFIWDKFRQKWHLHFALLFALGFGRKFYFIKISGI